MREQRPTILIATTNQGKLKEILEFFKTQDFNFISLNDLNKKIKEPKETGKTLIENALLKAKYYANITGHITIADDTGLYIELLDNWPGIYAARELDNDDTNFTNLLQKMKDKKNRSASFKCVTVVYDPDRDNTFIASGKLTGEIAKKPSKGRENNWGYNRIFNIPEKGISFAEMTLKEKIKISHRSKALNQIKYYLSNQYGSKQFIIPISLVIQNGKVLMNRRNDPHNEDVHQKWEFPGGGVDFGENLIQSVIRETKEETGYDIEIIKQLQKIHTEENTRQNGKIYYQIHVVPYICKIIGGKLNTSETEVLESKWFEIDDVLNHDLIATNKRMYKALIPELKKVIKQDKL